MAGSHWPITPIETSATSVVIAGRRPLTTKAIAVRPSAITNHGVPAE